MGLDIRYKAGAILTLFGCAGMAEAITEHGSFLISAIVFSVGFALILDSYVTRK